MDSANARKYLSIESDTTFDELNDTGLASYRGSLMKVAKRGTPYIKCEDRGRGLFLSEHRRCRTEIIEICNSMVYGGHLRPMRNDEPMALLPSLGYAHIPGTDERVGRSRRNLLEARAIAEWMASRREDIITTFKADGVSFGELVAVVTPYAAQVQAIQAELSRTLGSRHGITVGTVHSLQGAERRVVIFSPTCGLGTKPGEPFFDNAPSMLNVTVSRARDCFIVLGNMNLFNAEGNRPSSALAKHLYARQENELEDIPLEYLLPPDAPEGVLIKDLAAHRATLKDAFMKTKSQLVIVSPFLTKNAIESDEVLQRIQALTREGKRVTVVTDQNLNRSWTTKFGECVELLKGAHAEVSVATRNGVHSKLIMVDRSWLVIGSFNWLSAAREAKSPHRRFECSYRYSGPDAFEMIEALIEDLAELIASPRRSNDVGNAP